MPPIVPLPSVCAALRLTRGRAAPNSGARGGLDDRGAATFRGKSGLPLARVPGNARRGQPQGKRHREETALAANGGSPSQAPRVMVKRWGKSPPRTWQQGRHGKPHPEQCQIGASRGGWSRRKPGYRPQGCQRPRGPGWQLDRRGDTVGRGMVIHGRKPGTKSGLQALRAFDPSLCLPARPKNFRRKFLGCVRCALAVDSAARVAKRRASSISPGDTHSPMQRKRPWQSPPPSRSA
jgi:hypothetical protein